MNRKKITIVILIIITIFTLFFVYQKNKKQDIKIEPILITDSSPKNNAVFVDENTNINLILNRFLLPEDGSKIKIEITPETKFQSVYTGNSITINPDTALLLGSDYEVKIYYQDISVYTLIFSVNPFTKEQIETEGALQSKADFDFNEEYKKFYEKYPWHQQIPIEKKEYRIIYDFSVEQFRIRLLFKPNSSSDITELIDEAISDIEKLGVKKPVTNYYVIDFEGNRITTN